MENESGSVLNARVICSYFSAKNILSNYVHQLQPSDKIGPFSAWIWKNWCKIASLCEQWL